MINYKQIDNKHRICSPVADRVVWINRPINHSFCSFQSHVSVFFSVYFNKLPPFAFCNFLKKRVTLTRQPDQPERVEVEKNIQRNKKKEKGKQQRVQRSQHILKVRDFYHRCFGSLPESVAGPTPPGGLGGTWRRQKALIPGCYSSASHSALSLPDRTELCC